MAPLFALLTCVQDSLDPFDPKVLSKHGSFQGQCIDATTVRPVVKISESDEVIEVANFFHDGRYWLAVVPKNGVEEVLFQIVPFDSGVPLIQAAHTQVRFLMKKDIKLRTQSGRFPGQKLEINDVIISSTYTAPKGEEYSALKSLGSSYGIVTRFLSSTARAREEIWKDKSTVRQFKTKLTAEEKNKLLLLSLQRASDAGYNEDYGLLKNNCTTIGFDTLDLVRERPAGVHPLRGSLGNIRDEFIAPTLAALKARQLIDDTSEIQPMNAEIQCQGAPPECTYLRAKRPRALDLAAPTH